MALIQSYINFYNIKEKIENRIPIDMKLRNGKYSSLEKTFKNVSDMGNAKTKLKQQSEPCDFSSFASEVSVDFSGNKTNKDNSSTQKSLAGNKTNKDNSSTQKSLAIHSASCLTSSNNSVVNTVGQHSRILNVSSNLSSRPRSKKALVKRYTRFSNSSSGTSEKLQDNSPLVIDMTKGNEIEVAGKQKPISLDDSIRNEKNDCMEVVKEMDDLEIEVVRSLKRKRDRSVEVVSRNVKAKTSDTVLAPANKQPEKDVVLVSSTSSNSTNKGPSVDNDDCSIISVGSDEEIICLDTTKQKLNVNNSNDIIVLETPKRKGSVVIDLCTPVNHSTPFGNLRKSKRKSGCLKSSPKVSSTSQKPTFKNYVSILGGMGNENKKTSVAVTSSGSDSVANTNYFKTRVPSNEVEAITSFNPVLSALEPSTSKYGNNIYNPNPDTVKEGLRPVVIDGSNVAMGHGNGRIFSCRGLQICIDYFLKLNHKVIAFVPKFRKTSPHSSDREILDELEKRGLVTFTPSRRIGNRLVIAYDDRYIVQYAAECGGVIVSTDNYRDLHQENPTWRETIENRLLMFTWAGDIIMFPQDPLGRHGPNLENFLRFPAHMRQ